MITETEIVTNLINALETARFELLTLYPRLSGEYASNVKGASDKAKIALTNAKEFYRAHSNGPFEIDDYVDRDGKRI